VASGLQDPFSPLEPRRTTPPFFLPFTTPFFFLCCPPLAHGSFPVTRDPFLFFFSPPEIFVIVIAPLSFPSLRPPLRVVLKGPLSRRRFLLILLSQPVTGVIRPPFFSRHGLFLVCRFPFFFRELYGRTDGDVYRNPGKSKDFLLLPSALSHQEIRIPPHEEIPSRGLHSAPF